MIKKVLIADDEKNMRWAINKTLKKVGYQVIEASNGEECLKLYNQVSPDLILLDYKMPIVDGMSVLEKIKKTDSQVPVIMITAFGDTKSAIKAMKLGAFDYITKPFDLEKLKTLIKNALNIDDLKEQVNTLKTELKEKSNSEIIGKSPQLQKLLTTIKKVAPTVATVLITGESGTGKEVLANAIHYNSARQDMPFIKVNCGAIPENLIESELFGHEKGAFTGATTRKKGKFELAHGGTIFLDEIGELPKNLQVKLLRVIQQQEIERVGGEETIEIDTRIIAATNKNLAEQMSKGLFREDLYYRLNVVPIYLPPLRKRKEDIPLLIGHFLEKMSNELGRGKLEIDEQALQLLLNYRWKGNIRELQNLIERIVIMSDSNLITVKDIPQDLTQDQDQQPRRWQLPSEGISLEKLEKDLIQQALSKASNNKTQAAKLLNISRQALLYRIEKHKLT
ncbi:sigma-54 dependent transcriptional regulator [Proteinivorax tanatarense]|uniref:Stage 0 sporulation protein A homolog n=1 Tax=Proteinivorax tanatarense TaxID=1260629 RepID=A0AAU7VPP5_9FIRM